MFLLKLVLQILYCEELDDFNDNLLLDLSHYNYNWMLIIQ